MNIVLIIEYKQPQFKTNPHKWDSFALWREIIYILFIFIDMWSCTHAHLYITETQKGAVAIISNILFFIPSLLSRYQMQTHSDHLKIKSVTHHQSVDCAFDLRVLHSGWLRVLFPSSVLKIFFPLFCLEMILKFAFPNSFLLCGCCWAKFRALCTVIQCRIWPRADKSDSKGTCGGLTLYSFSFELAGWRQCSVEHSRSPRVHHPLYLHSIWFSKLSLLILLFWICLRLSLKVSSENRSWHFK